MTHPTHSQQFPTHLQSLLCYEHFSASLTPAQRLQQSFLVQTGNTAMEEGVPFQNTSNTHRFIHTHLPRCFHTLVSLLL